MALGHKQVVTVARITDTDDDGGGDASGFLAFRVHDEAGADAMGCPVEVWWTDESVDPVKHNREARGTVADDGWIMFNDLTVRGYDVEFGGEGMFEPATVQVEPDDYEDTSLPDRSK